MKNRQTANSNHPMGYEAKPAWKSLFMPTLFLWAILTHKVGQTDLVLAHDKGALVGLCMQDYKSLCAAVVICSTLVNMQTDTLTLTQTAFQQFF